MFGLKLDHGSHQDDQVRAYHSRNRALSLIVGSDYRRWGLELTSWTEETVLLLAWPRIEFCWRVGKGRPMLAGRPFSWGFTVFGNWLHLTWGSRISILPLSRAV